LLIVAMTVDDDAPALARTGGFGAVAVIAAAVVAGAALGSPTSLVVGALARRPLVWLGRISYALYLWHWPVVVAVGTATPARQAVAALVSLTLAALTTRVVEQPFRVGVRHLRPALGAAVAVVAALVVMMPERTSVAIPETASGVVTAPSPTPVTIGRPSTTLAPAPVATSATPPAAAAATITTTTTTLPPRTTALPVARSVLVLGDSVGWVLASNVPPDIALNVRGAWHSKCDIVGPRIFLGDAIDEEDPTCPQLHEEWANALAGPADVVVVTLGLRQLFDLDVDGVRVVVGSAEWEARYRAAIVAAVSTIRARTAAPILWFDVPCYDWASAETAGEERDAARLRRVNAVLDDELRAADVRLVPYADRVCDGSTPRAGVRPDGVHPSVEQTHDLWRWLRSTVDATSGQPSADRDH
jgi:hypothetical protein